MKHIKTIFQFIIILTFFIACSTGKKNISTITLNNKSEIDLKNKAVAIKKEEIKNLPAKTNLFPLITTENGDTIPSQLDDTDGDGNWNQLFFVADVPAGNKAVLTLSWEKNHIDYVKKTSVRFGKRDSKDAVVTPRTSDTLKANEVHAALGYQPYQTDGPSWENDKVGFRHYYDGRNAKDLFGKKVSYMSPDSVGIDSVGGVRDNYHVMRDWGRDILAVGNSVGLGGTGLMINDSIARIGIIQGDTLNNIEESIFTILTEGPVHSIINFKYNNWKAGDRNYNVSEKVDIWPGMYAYRNEVSFSGLQGDETLLVGLVKIFTENELTQLETEKYVILYTHDMQTYDKIWTLGMALIIPKESFIGSEKAPDDGVISKTYLAKLKIENNKPVNYYAVGCWEISDEGFKNEPYFTEYILNLTKQIETELEIKVE